MIRRRLAALPLPENQGLRVLLAVGAVLLAVNLLAFLLDAIFPSPSGPRSSSYATAAEGTAGWADLLRREGRDVRALRRTPSDRSLPRSGTIVIFDPDALLPREAQALRRFALRGGRVVAGGREPGGWVPILLGGDADPVWLDEAGRRARVLVPAPETAGVARVATAGEGAWRAAGETLPALAAGDRPILLLARAGRGRIALLADPSPLHNERLGQADNAALALALAGPEARAGGGIVYFAESVHGYGEARGLAALPARFKWALGLLGLAGLGFVVARGRRLGPPELERRELAPARLDYVEALSATLARGGRGTRDEAVAPVREAARARLARRAGLPDGADDAAVEAAGRRAGLGAREARAIARPAGSDADVLAVGRALATLERREEAV